MGKLFAITGATAMGYQGAFSNLLGKVFDNRFEIKEFRDLFNQSVNFSKNTVALVSRPQLILLEKHFHESVVPIEIMDRDSYQQGFADIAATLFQKTGGTIAAFDGTSGSGKTTIAKTFGKMVNGIDIDSGIFYRYIAHHAQNVLGISPNQTNIQDIIFKITESYEPINQSILRTPQIDMIVPVWSKIPVVRKAAFELQMKAAYFPRNTNYIFPNGRDMTTQLFRKAQFKYFIDTPIELRAKWRSEQNGKSLIENRKSLEQRDYDDMTREISPLSWDEEGGVIKIINNREFDHTIDSIKEIMFPQISRV